MDDVQVAAVDGASAEAQWAMTQYFAELDARFPEGFDETGALDDAAIAYNPPLGLFVLATLNGSTVACGGLQVIDDNTAELKRMWVSPNHRGQGLASTLTEAITLYERRGYQPTERFYDNPYAKRWFRKTI